VKIYIHARLRKEDRTLLDALKKSAAHSESELVRRGLQLISKEIGRQRSAVEFAGRSVGKFRKGLRDLATNKKHLEGFGK